MALALSHGHLSEIAQVRRPAWCGPYASDRINRFIARSEGFNESLSNCWGQGIYGLFEEMEEKDAHLYSVLQTRKYGLIARQRTVEPASPAEADRNIGQWLAKTIDDLPDWDNAIYHLLDAIGKGMAVLEIIWGYDREGRIVPVQLKPRGAWRFNFGADGSLYLNDSDPLGVSSVEQTGSSGDTNRSTRALYSSNSSFALRSSSFGRALPNRKFIVMTFNATDERPYGRGLCERVYWYWWFKKNNLKFWVMYNEKFGAPTVVAKHTPGLAQAERDRLLEVIQSIQADAGVTIPDGITLDLLESNRRGTAETYRDLSNWCNDEMSRAVLGQTLTVSEGFRSGSYALGRVHEAVRFDYIRADACLLMNVINSQLIRWIVDFNFGEKVPAPRWMIDLNPDIDAEIEVKIDRQLLQMGVPLSLPYLYAKYRRPAPASGERSIRYDDNNLFQYHLQFGVLTVNEVRASLGLPPVPWGNSRTSPAAPSSSQSTFQAAAGDGPNDEQAAEQKREVRREK